MFAVIFSIVTLILIIIMIIISNRDPKIEAWVESEYPPIRAHSEDAGLDLRSPIDIVIPQGSNVKIDSKVHIAIPYGFFGKLESKSGLNVKHGIVCLGGIIDSGYTGSIVIKLYNFGTDDYHISTGDKIVQLIIQPCRLSKLKYISKEEWESKTTERGNNGFGSTGK